MCTLIVLHRCFPDAQLVVAANRDEYLDRPTEGPALRPWNGRVLLAPRDVRAGGSWLGRSNAGLFAALTNRPVAAPDPARRSRGLLVNDVLAAHENAEGAAKALASLPPGAYNAFNLLVADGERAFVAVYEGSPEVTELAPGAHVIGNADPDDRTHPKVGRILAEAEAVAAGTSAEALDRLAGLCRAHVERGGNPLADTCIHHGGYGTRSSTLLRVGSRAEDDRFLWLDGSPCETGFEDRTHLLRELDRTTGIPYEAKTRNVA